MILNVNSTRLEESKEESVRDSHVRAVTIKRTHLKYIIGPLRQQHSAIVQNYIVAIYQIHKMHTDNKKNIKLIDINYALKA